jgi:hypothetical protein
MPKKPKSVPIADRKAIYTSYSSVCCCGKDAITVEQAKELLGWRTESDQDKWGSDFMLLDRDKKKVRCLNNVRNRPIYSAVVATLVQEHLRKRWQFNGEPIIVGRTGLILNGQHTLISLVLAAQDWAADKDKWSTTWKHEPTMEKLVVYGVDESDAVVNTMDTCRPRSFADVVYRSQYFASMKGGDQKRCARACDYAVRLLWHRTGACLDAFAPRRTHAESLDFLARHPKLLEAVQHVYEEDGDERLVARYVSVGYAAALLYLMATSETPDDSEYRTSDHPSEAMLDLGRWDKACEFWVVLASGDKTFKKVFAEVVHEGGSQAERWALVVKAWLSFVEHGKIKESGLNLAYVENDEGVLRLAEHPACGGIDLGDPKEVDEEQVAANDPTPEQIERRAKRKQTAKAQPPQTASRAGAEWAEGDRAWVEVADGDHYLATLIESPYPCDDGQKRVMVRDGDGKDWEVAELDLRLTRPTAAATPATANSPAAAAPKAGSPLAASPKPKTKAKRPKSATSWATGNLCWVRDDEHGEWRGRIVDLQGKTTAVVRVETGFQGAGVSRTVPLVRLHHEQSKPDGKWCDVCQATDCQCKD